MALTNTDLFIVERAGVQYKMTAQQLADFNGAVHEYTANTIGERDAGTLSPTPPGGGLKVGDRVFVVDASADLTVTADWAVYRVGSTGPIVYDKIQEKESLDQVVSGGGNLSYTPSPTNGVVTNSGGTDATIPLATDTNAGLASPAMFNAVHLAASAGGTAASNPVAVNGGTQVITFNITSLTSLP
jgi:hypothetical protein